MTNRTITKERGADIKHIALSADECIRIINGPKGWMAQVFKIEHISHGTERFSPIGEKIGVSRFVNRLDGGDRIAAMFGK